MALISITRLQLRSLRVFPQFAWYVWASTRQAQRAPGFLGGRLAVEGLRAFWTITAWSDDGALERYRIGGAHRGVMPRLIDWCDEASVAHWRQDGPELPDMAEALRRMTSEGRLSRVRRPSPEHAAGRTAYATPRPGPQLRPSGRTGPCGGRGGR